MLPPIWLVCLISYPSIYIYYLSYQPLLDSTRFNHQPTFSWMCLFKKSDSKNCEPPVFTGTTLTQQLQRTRKQPKSAKSLVLGGAGERDEFDVNHLLHQMITAIRLLEKPVQNESTRTDWQKCLLVCSTFARQLNVRIEEYDAKTQGEVRRLEDLKPPNVLNLLFGKDWLENNLTPRGSISRKNMFGRVTCVTTAARWTPEKAENG